MGWTDVFGSLALGAVKGAVKASPAGIAMGAVSGAMSAVPAKKGSISNLSRPRRRRRGIPKSIMADVMVLKNALGQRAAESTLHILLRR